jgi:hypothetical protein
MTREEKLNCVINIIQTDAKLIQLLKLVVANNLPNIPDDKLDQLLSALN